MSVAPLSRAPCANTIHSCARSVPVLHTLARARYICDMNHLCPSRSRFAPRSTHTHTCAVGIAHNRCMHVCVCMCVYVCLSHNSHHTHTAGRLACVSSGMLAILPCNIAKKSQHPAREIHILGDRTRLHNGSVEKKPRPHTCRV